MMFLILAMLRLGYYCMGVLKNFLLFYWNLSIQLKQKHSSIFSIYVTQDIKVSNNYIDSPSKIFTFFTIISSPIAIYILIFIMFCMSSINTYGNIIIMFPVLTTLFTAFILYSLFKIARRYLIKPNFKGKNVWITGSSSGIGQYLAYEFNALDANLIISARGLDQLNRVKLSCKFPERVKVVQLDMTNYQQIEVVTAQIIKQLQDKGEKLDIVVQNAGVSMRCLFQEYSFKNHLFMQSVNVHGPFLHIQCLLNHMIGNKNGHIVGITSVAAKLATSHRSSYAGSKHALIALLDSLRTQLHGQGISVTNIMPGYINTNLSKNALVSGEGEKLGFTDKNIAHGLSASSFAKASVRAIYNKEKQLQISGSLMVPVAIALRNLCPDLTFLIMKQNSRSQAEAIARR